MHEKNNTNLLEKVNTGLEELEAAQQFIQKTTDDVDILRERIRELVEIAEEKSRQLETLLAQIDNLGLQESQEDNNASSGHPELLQLGRQEELAKELSSYLEELEKGLNGLYSSVEQLGQSIKERNESLLASSTSLSQEEGGEILLKELNGLRKTIEEERQKAYSQMFLVNEQQIKLLSGQNNLIEQMSRQSRAFYRWFPGVGIGLLLILSFCLALLLKSPGQPTNAGSDDEQSGIVDAGKQITASDYGEIQQNNTSETNIAADPAESKNDNPEKTDSLPASKDEKTATPAKKQAEGAGKSDSLSSKGIPEAPTTSPQLYPPRRAEMMVTPRDEYSLTYLKEKNFNRLSLKYIHPEKGVLFLPFGLKTPGKIFSATSLKEAMSSSEIYHWGSVEGAALEMDFKNYYDNYIFDVDFTDGTEPHYNEVHFSGKSGLTAAQIAQRFPDCIFVEFCKSGKSLILVFERPSDSLDWAISAIIHNH